MDRHFARRLSRWIGEGLVAAALVDRDGRTIALAGRIAEEEAMPLAALVMYRLRSEDLAERLFAGEILSLQLDEPRRDVAVGVAKRQLFVVAVVDASTPAALTSVGELRDAVEQMLADRDEIDPVPEPGPGGSGGSAAGPAELQLVELGITVRGRRERAKA